MLNGRRAEETRGFSFFHPQRVLNFSFVPLDPLFAWKSSKIQFHIQRTRYSKPLKTWISSFTKLTISSRILKNVFTKKTYTQNCPWNPVVLEFMGKVSKTALDAEKDKILTWHCNLLETLNCFLSYRSHQLVIQCYVHTLLWWCSGFNWSWADILSFATTVC